MEYKRHLTVYMDYKRQIGFSSISYCVQGQQLKIPTLNIAMIYLFSPVHAEKD